jgi:hypothetical protein
MVPAAAAAQSSTVDTTSDQLIAGQKTFTGVPLQIVGPDPQTSANLFEIVGPTRDPITGYKYRVTVNQNVGLIMNTALIIQGSEWTDGGRSPGPIANEGPMMLGIESDVNGPALVIKGNAGIEPATGRAGPNIRCYDHASNKVFEVIQPSGSGGMWLGIGDVPVSTLTLSDVHDPSQPTSLVIRHGGASARIYTDATASLDISSNSLGGENSIAEHAIRVDRNGLSFLKASAPGATRREVLFIGENFVRLRTSGFQIQSVGGTSEFLVFEPGSGNIRFGTSQTGNGAGVIGMRTAAIQPSVNPTPGAGILWAFGTALKWRPADGETINLDRQPAVLDADGTLASVTTQLNTLLLRLRPQGLGLIA